MLDPTVLPRIAKVIRTEVKDPPTTYNINDAIPGDSLDRINVVIGVEKEFGVELGDDIHTVKDLALAVSVKPKTRFWVSWLRDPYVKFTLHSPWWISGYRDGQATICAAIEAASEEAAKALIVAAHDTPVDLEWRFCTERDPDWSPFCNRFPRASWMVWP